MAEFVQPPDQQDPDALKKALLAKLFGGPIPGAVPPPGATQRSLTGTPDPGTPPTLSSTATTQPNASNAPAAPPSTQPNVFGGPANSSATATPISTAPANAGPQPARPINAGRSATTAPTGMARPASSNSAAIEPGNQPPPNVAPFPNEADWSKQNPLPTHTPYQAPDWKHRLLMGIFSGMQEFGRPGEGAATVRNYLGDIERRTDEEKNYPTTSAGQQHQRYMGAVQAAKGPIDLENMRAELDDRFAQAEERRAKADALRNPKAQLQHVVIADPKTGDPTLAAFDRATGKYLNPETGEPIAGAKAWEKKERPERPFNLDEQELEARKNLRTAKTPEERAAAQAQISDIRASRQRPEEPKPPKEAHLTPGQKFGANRQYQKALDDIETESRARASGTYVHPRSGELMPPMTEDELTQRKQRAEDEYKDALEAGGEPNVRRFNYHTGQYEGGEAPLKSQPAKPTTTASAKANSNERAAPSQHQVNDEVMYQGKRHKITAIQNGKATLQPLE